MGLTLTRYGPVLKNRKPCRHNWTLQVSAKSDEDGLSAKIFVYHAVPEQDPIEGDTFSNVASLQDMNEIPEDAPVELTDATSKEDYVPYYRTDTVTFDCHNLQEAERVWNIVKMDTKSLLDEYRIARNLKENEIVRYE